MEQCLLDLTAELIDDDVEWDLKKSCYPLAENEDPKMHLMNLLNKYKIKPPKPIVLEKSVELSKMWRTYGNKHYSQFKSTENLIQACFYYTKSITFAPNNSVEQALAYANKSATLFRMERFLECIQNIDRCLNLKYPNNLKEKVLLRKIECLINLGDTAGAKKAFETAEKWIEKNVPKTCKSNLKTKLNEIYSKPPIEKKKENHHKDSYKDFICKSPNKEVPVMSDAVVLNYDKNGRHSLVAARDIRPCEIIAQENAYCSVMKTENNCFMYCWLCKEISWNAVACDNCVHVVYCSIKCKREAWRKFHEFECPILQLFLQLDIINSTKEVALGTFKLIDDHYKKKSTISPGMNALVALRLTILAVKEMGSIEKLKVEVEEVDKCTDLHKKGFSKNKRFNSNKYRSVYSLFTSQNDDDHFVSQHKLFTSVLSAYYLATETTFFGEKFENWVELMENEQVQFITDLILKNSWIEYNSSFSMCSAIRHALPAERIQNNYDETIAILPVLSFLEHSCDPNAIVICDKNMGTLFATYPIKEGQKICTSYVPSIIEYTKDSRQEILKNKFNSTCECIACKEDWPIRSKFKHYNNLVNTKKTQSVLNEQFLKVQKYVDSPEKMFDDDRNLVLQRIRKTIEVFCKYVKLLCAEVD